MTYSPPASRGLATKSLHLLLLLAVVHQLVTSWFMSRPRPGTFESSGFGYGLHEVVGLASLAVLCLFWLWTLLRRREHGLGHLLPWFSRVRRRALKSDLAMTIGAVSRLRMPWPGDPSPFAGAIHGLGLIIATMMAVSGLFVFRGMGADGGLSRTAAAALNVHKLGANLMWAYLVAHSFIAFAHEFAGHRVLARMFAFARKRP